MRFIRREIEVTGYGYIARYHLKDKMIPCFISNIGLSDKERLMQIKHQLNGLSRYRRYINELFK